MTTSTIQAKGETMVPKIVRQKLKLQAGDTVGWDADDTKAIVRKRVAFSAPPAKLIRQKGRTYLDNGRRITLKDVQGALEQFP